MGQINTTNLPNYVPETQAAVINSKTTNDTAASSSPSVSAPPQDDLQLTKLSSVLNGLKKGATTMRSQLTQVMGAVRSGTYDVDPLEVSRSIVGESIASR